MFYNVYIHFIKFSHILLTLHAVYKVCMCFVEFACLILYKFARVLLRIIVVVQENGK